MQAFYERLKQLFSDVGSDMQEQKTRVDNLINGVEQPSEVVDMHLGRDGQTYPVARDMVLGEIGKTESAQAAINADTAAQLADTNQQLSLKANINDVNAQIAAVAQGSPIPVSLVANMTDHTKNYVYTGSESGYTAGHWYYWNSSSSSWTEGGTYLPTGLADGAVDVNNLSDSIKLKGYPFDGQALVPPSIRSAILDIKLYNTDKTKQYTLAVVKRNDPNDGNYWRVQIYEWINGNFGVPICTWEQQNYVMSSSIEVLRLTSTTGAFCDITINWSLFPDGTVLIGNTFQQCGIHPLAYIGRSFTQNNFPFIDGINVPNTIKSAIKSINISNADPTKLYTLSVLRKNSITGGTPNSWTVTIHEWVNDTFENPACSFNIVNYVPKESLDLVHLSPVSPSNLQTNADVLVDWSKLADGFAYADGYYYLSGINQSAISYFNGLPKQLNMLKYRKSKNVDSNYFDTAAFIGYWEKRTVNSKECMVTTFMGSELISKISGTASIVANFELVPGVSGFVPTITYKIDDGDWTTVSTANAVTLATGLSTDEHILRIRSEDLNLDDDQFHTLTGIWNFSGFTLDSGGAAESVKPKSRYAIYLGDSITAGVGAHTAFNYVAKACEKLNVQDIRIAIPGGGLVNGSRPYLPPLTEYAYSSSSGINGVSDDPDFICVNIGTNDGITSSTDFKAAFGVLLERLQRRFPGVDIFCMGAFNGSHASDVSVIVPNYQNAVFVDTSSWGPFTTVDGTHPDEPGSETLGSRLAEFLINYYGKEYFSV